MGGRGAGYRSFTGDRMSRPAKQARAALRIRSLDDYQKHGRLDELLVIFDLLARLGLINRYPLLISHFDWLPTEALAAIRREILARCVATSSDESERSNRVA